MEIVNGDNWSYKTWIAPVKSSSTNQHPTFYSPDVLPVAQPTVSNHWRKINLKKLNQYSLTFGSICISAVLVSETGEDAAANSYIHVNASLSIQYRDNTV